MRYNWRLQAKKADFNRLAARFGIDKVVARVIRNRDIISDEEFEQYLYGTLEMTHAPEDMLDMDLGVDIIRDAIEQGESIRVVGDYDVDGIMSTYILYTGLKVLGANVSYDIPHRVKDGYGINERIINQAYEDGVQTIITCDNGIAATNAIRRARELGMTVVITDHHEIPPELPDADAIIDPHQTEDFYPYEDICGAVVAYKFISMLFDVMGAELGRFTYLEAVALATVCDVMPLQDENRIYVREGMKRIEVTEIVGLRALLRECGLEGKVINAYHLGFILGPCLNAAGKLDDAKFALELMLCTDADKAATMAAQLKSLNESRKTATEDGVKKALETLTLVESDGEEIPVDNVLLVYVPGLHEGLAGIVAGRLRESYYRPTIVFTDTESDESILKGSGRSIENYNMFEALDRHRDMMVKFGGHPMAAGLSIQRSDLDRLRRMLNEECSLTAEQLTPKLMIDVPMPLSYVTMSVAEQLTSLGPFGKGNESPLFAERGLEVLGCRIYGQRKNVMSLKLKNNAGRISYVTSFRPDDFVNHIKVWFGENICDKMLQGAGTGIKLDICYEVSINEYNGERNVQLLLVAYDKA